MPPASNDRTNHIGTLNEKPLHKALKKWYSMPSDQFEVEVDGYIIDIKRGPLLIEIQSINVAKIRRKIEDLIHHHPLRLILPIAKDKWIVRIDRDGSTQLSRRKSPKHGSFFDVFSELVHIPRLIEKENFSLEVLLIQEEELRQHERGRAWRRRGWVTQQRKLIKVLDQRRLEKAEDLAAFLPALLPDPFTNADLADSLSIRPRLTQQMSYCLRHAGIIELIGKKGRFNLYARIT